MDFASFFRKYYEDNVGGAGATFAEDTTLCNLGFGKRDADVLTQELGIEASLDATVAQLRKAVGSRKVGVAVTPAKREVKAHREPDINISGCGMRTEVSFVSFLRSWYQKTHSNLGEQEVSKLVHRETPVSFFDKTQLLRALQERWPSVQSVGPSNEKLNVAGLMGYLANHSKEFREWDYSQGPRGG